MCIKVGFYINSLMIRPMVDLEHKAGIHTINKHLSIKELHTQTLHYILYKGCTGCSRNSFWCTVYMGFRQDSFLKSVIKHFLISFIRPGVQAYIRLYMNQDVYSLMVVCPYHWIMNLFIAHYSHDIVAYAHKSEALYQL